MNGVPKSNQAFLSPRVGPPKLLYSRNTAYAAFMPIRGPHDQGPSKMAQGHSAMPHHPDMPGGSARSRDTHCNVDDRNYGRSIDTARILSNRKARSFRESFPRLRGMQYVPRHGLWSTAMVPINGDDKPILKGEMIWIKAKSSEGFGEGRMPLMKREGYDTAAHGGYSHGRC